MQHLRIDVFVRITTSYPNMSCRQNLRGGKEDFTIIIVCFHLQQYKTTFNKTSARMMKMAL